MERIVVGGTVGGETRKEQMAAEHGGDVHEARRAPCAARGAARCSAWRWGRATVLRSAYAVALVCPDFRPLPTDPPPAAHRAAHAPAPRPSPRRSQAYAEMGSKGGQKVREMSEEYKSKQRGAHAFSRRPPPAAACRAQRAAPAHNFPHPPTYTHTHTAE